jgi:hypothetical protein
MVEGGSPREGGCLPRMSEEDVAKVLDRDLIARAECRKAAVYRKICLGIEVGSADPDLQLVILIRCTSIRVLLGLCYLFHQWAWKNQSLLDRIVLLLIKFKLIPRVEHRLEEVCPSQPSSLKSERGCRVTHVRRINVFLLQSFPCHLGKPRISLVSGLVSNCRLHMAACARTWKNLTLATAP